MSIDLSEPLYLSLSLEDWEVVKAGGSLPSDSGITNSMRIAEFQAQALAGTHPFEKAVVVKLNTRFLLRDYGFPTFFKTELHRDYEFSLKFVKEFISTVIQYVVAFFEVGKIVHEEPTDTNY